MVLMNNPLSKCERETSVKLQVSFLNKHNVILLKSKLVFSRFHTRCHSPTRLCSHTEQGGIMQN